MTITAAAPGIATEPTRINAIVFASCIGTIIEWYDFSIHATAAALVFNKAFFPTFDPLAFSVMMIVLALITLAAALAARETKGTSLTE